MREKGGGTRCARDRQDSVDSMSTSWQGTPTPELLLGVRGKHLVGVGVGGLHHEGLCWKNFVPLLLRENMTAEKSEESEVGSAARSFEL